uniref:Uncharacterized protein n=1 Tax=Panagrolaimus sp. JU765 TaxID=591449 RepID=A0AC34QZZ4_9BILA
MVDCGVETEVDATWQVIKKAKLTVANFGRAH